MMKRTVTEWKAEELYELRSSISFPEYQRQPNLWSDEKKGRLIDSMLRDIDVPKLYFNQTSAGTYEVVDGTQRLWSLWQFFDGVFPLQVGKELKYFGELDEKRQAAIRDFKFQVTVLENADDDYLRELFLRLQLGLLLVTGEKLNAATGKMRDFVFGPIASHAFVKGLGMPNRRYARETLGAQITINSFSRRPPSSSFSRTRYEDLLDFFQRFAHPAGEDETVFKEQTEKITSVLDGLWEAFGKQATAKLANRSFVLSVFLLFEAVSSEIATEADRTRFRDFTLALSAQLRAEAKAGIKRTNQHLFEFESMLSSAPGERYQIERRHSKLMEFYRHYVETEEILATSPA